MGIDGGCRRRTRCCSVGGGSCQPSSLVFGRNLATRSQRVMSLAIPTSTSDTCNSTPRFENRVQWNLRPGHASFTGCRMPAFGDAGHACTVRLRFPPTVDYYRMPLPHFTAFFIPTPRTAHPSWSLTLTVPQRQLRPALADRFNPSGLLCNPPAVQAHES